MQGHNIVACHDFQLGTSHAFNGFIGGIRYIFPLHISHFINFTFNPLMPIVANLPQTASIQNAAETVHVFPQCWFIPYIRRQNEHN